ncbi:MAG: phenylacetate--CoA ligase family protein [Planctomycetes bacterium]|nr:phenylacetate--CoA ligase family protein [Planctomycetota bacterium]MBI3847083.1 phenylacetate--CoA ligase family protein [Planctomycetota bacterium]
MNIDSSGGNTGVLSEPSYPDSHWEATSSALAWALEAIPLYAGHARHGDRTRIATASMDADATKCLLRELPILSKQDIRLHFPKQLLPTGFDWRAAVERNEAVLVATSGTTDERLQLLWEEGWWERQERAALCLHPAVRLVLSRDYREAVLTSPLCSGTTCHSGPTPLAERTIGNLLFLNQRGDPTYWTDSDVRTMVSELNAFEPDGLEADPAYLAELCRRARRLGLDLHQPSYVTLSYEFVSGLHRREIAKALSAPLLNLYGSTEAGVLFMECERGLLHHNHDYSHVELVPSGLFGAPTSLARVLVTQLSNRFTPLLRYDIGDLAFVEARGCDCGAGDGWVLRSIEGRLKDVTTTTRSEAVTVGELDREISQTRELAAYQVIQERDRGRWLIRWVAGDDARGTDEIEREITDRMRVLYGADAHVECRRERFIAPEPSGKYRLAMRKP